MLEYYRLKQTTVIPWESGIHSVSVFRIAHPPSQIVLTAAYANSSVIDHHSPMKQQYEVEFIEHQTGLDPTHSVIWLHGLGADGHDFEPIVPQLAQGEAVRFVFPHAPMRPITVNGGMVMRGWYDIADLPLDPKTASHEDRAGLEESAQRVRGLVEQERRRGIPPEKIFLAGFSQGGAVALFLGLRFEEKLAGIVALSTYLPAYSCAETEFSAAGRATPVFMGHGTGDPLIPVHLGKLGAELLSGLGYAVQWHSYPMPHSVHPQEILDIAGFFKANMSSAG